MNQQRLKNERFKGLVLVRLNMERPYSGHCYRGGSPHARFRVGSWRGPLHTALFSGEAKHLKFPLNVRSHVP
jgi:hypothetical protein